MEKLDRRFDDMVRGAAQITGTSFTKEKFSTDCRSRKPNAPLNEAFIEIMTELGEKVSPIPAAGRASSDFGDFSQTIPGSHCYFGISPVRIGGHSIEFQEASRSEYGLNGKLKSACALACTACRFLDDEEFRKAVQTEFAS